MRKIPVRNFQCYGSLTFVSGDDAALYEYLERKGKLLFWVINLYYTHRDVYFTLDQLKGMSGENDNWLWNKVLEDLQPWITQHENDFLSLGGL